MEKPCSKLQKLHIKDVNNRTISNEKTDFFCMIDEIIGDSHVIKPKYVASLGLELRASSPEASSMTATVSEESISIPDADSAEESSAAISEFPKRKERKIRPPTRSEHIEESIKKLVEENKTAVMVDKEQLKLMTESRNAEEKNEMVKLEVYKDKERERIAAYRERTNVIKAHNTLIEEQIKSVEADTKLIKIFLEKKFGPLTD